MTDYTLQSLIHRQLESNQTHFREDFDGFNEVKFTNSNTNINKVATSRFENLPITKILQKQKEESIQFGHIYADSLFNLLYHPAYLEYKNIIQNDKVTKCSTFGDTYEDINGHEGFKPALCGNRNQCLIDSTIYTNTLATDAFELLKTISDIWRNNGMGKLYFTDDTFTLPKNMEQKVYSMGNEGIKLFRNATIEFYKLFYGGLPAGCTNFQDWHTDNPLSGSHCHFHTYGLNLFFRTESIFPFDYSSPTSERFFVKKPYVDIDFAISVWYGCVKRLASKLHVKLEDSILNGDKKLVWNHDYIEFNPLAYTETKKGIKKSNYNIIKHALNYDMRKPILDIVKFLGSDSYTPYTITTQEKDRLMELIKPDRNKKNIVWIGWLADGVKNKYMSLLNLHIMTNKEIRIKRSESPETLNSYTCPICGELMAQSNDGKFKPIQKISPMTIILTQSMRSDYMKIKRVIPLANAIKLNNRNFNKALKSD